MHCDDPDQVKNWGDEATDIDPDTQLALQHNTNPCLLMREGVTENGGYFDSSLISTYGDSDPTTRIDGASTSCGGSACGTLGWPFDDATVKKYWLFFLGSHTLDTGTAWGADSMGTRDKGAGIADDIGVPSGTSVQAMLGGTVTSTNLCGSGDGVAIKSTVGGHTIGISYMHGTSQTVKVGDTVTAGQVIMKSGELGCHVYGAHLHIGIAVDGKYVCPQDVFKALKAGETPDWGALPAKASPGCSGRFE
jgi:hypothetical protein